MHLGEEKGNRLTNVMTPYVKALALLPYAWLVRRGLLRGGLTRHLPPPRPSATPLRGSPEEELPHLARVDAMLAPFLKASRHPCYYRCFVLARLFSAAGVRVVVNVGGRGLADALQRKAHCWLTWEDRPLLEKSNSFNLYPNLLGESPDGAVRYWVGAAFDRRVLDDSRAVRAKFYEKQSIMEVL
jgi:hypothetical protein